MFCLFCNFKSKQNNSLSSPQEYIIQHLGRWKRINLLRQTSSQVVELGYKDDIVKYARNQRFNTKSQREAYEKILMNYLQINYILNGNEIDLDEDKSNDDDDNNPYLKIK